MKERLAHRIWARVFRLVPSIVLAEPFELFWAFYGTIGAVAIVIRAARHQLPANLASLPHFGPGNAGVYTWAAVLFSGSALIATGLLAAGRSPLAVRPRQIEGAGLILFSAPLAQQLWLAVVTLTHGGPLFVYQLLNTLTLGFLVLSAVVRVVAISSPAGIMAVSRISRIRLVRKQLNELRRGDGDERG